jgi:RNA polymerase sigma-70 factor, ECF subfamily
MRASDARAAVDRSFEQLYRGHHADVFRAALRELGNVHDAEDVTQAAFVDAYRAVLRGSRPESPRAWLLAIAENVRRRRYRTAQRRPREEPIDADFPLSADLPHELATSLAEALAELPAEQRQVFVLRELGGLSYDEIAAETDSTVGAIQMQLFRARRSLRERLEPPTVARRRAGLFVPLPGWLTSIVSRVDISLPAVRTAGAFGASVAAVVGGTIAVTEVAADTPPAAVEPRPALVTRVVDPAPVPIARLNTATTASSTAAVRPREATRRTAPAKRPAQPVQSVQPVQRVQPVPAAAVPTVVTAPPPRPSVVVTATRLLEPRLLEPPRLPVRLPVEKVERVVELPSTPELQVPPLPTAPIPEASGAARAAGDGAQPLPVPGVPPVTVPPAP